jgi:hypothetical protein
MSIRQLTGRLDMHFSMRLSNGVSPKASFTRVDPKVALNVVW